MDAQTLISVLTCLGTIVCNIVSIYKVSSLMQYRLSQLEQKVDKHNGMVERTFKLEGAVQELQHDVRDLKRYHDP